MEKKTSSSTRLKTVTKHNTSPKESEVKKRPDTSPSDEPQVIAIISPSKRSLRSRRSLIDTNAVVFLDDKKNNVEDSMPVVHVQLERLSISPETTQCIVTNGKHATAPVITQLTTTPIVEENDTPETSSEKRLVKKFCYVKESQVCRSDPPNILKKKTTPVAPEDGISLLKKKIPLAPRIRVQRFMHSGAQLPPFQIKKKAFNEVTQRHERLLQIFPREVQVTESSTQTDESELAPLIDKSTSPVPEIAMIPQADNHPLPEEILPTLPEEPDLPEEGTPALPAEENEELNEIQTELDKIMDDMYENQKAQGEKRPSDFENDDDTPLSKRLKCFKDTKALQVLPLDRQITVANARRGFDTCLRRDPFGNLPLHIAVLRGTPELISRYALYLNIMINKIDIPNGLGYTPLHLAIKCHRSTEVVRTLLDRGANPLLKDKKNNDSVFHIAAAHNCMNALKVLLPPAKSIINDMNHNGFTALHIAAMKGCKEMIDMMLKTPGIDINLQDRRSGRSALFHALENGYTRIAETIVKEGGNFSSQNFAGQTIINLAADSEAIKPIVQALTKVKKNLDKASKRRSAMNVLNEDSIYVD